MYKYMARYGRQGVRLVCRSALKVGELKRLCCAQAWPSDLSHACMDLLAARASALAARGVFPGADVSRWVRSRSGRKMQAQVRRHWSDTGQRHGLCGCWQAPNCILRSSAIAHSHGGSCTGRQQWRTTDAPPIYFLVATLAGKRLPLISAQASLSAAFCNCGLWNPITAYDSLLICVQQCPGCELFARTLHPVRRPVASARATAPPRPSPSLPPI